MLIRAGLVAILTAIVEIWVMIAVAHQIGASNTAGIFQLGILNNSSTVLQSAP